MIKLALLPATLLIVAASSLLSTAAWSGNHYSVTPGAVTRMIEIYGGERAVDMLIARKVKNNDNDLGRFELVLDGIMSGDSAWLALVPRLNTGGHAAAGESLPISLAFALPKNAAGVLRLLARDRRWLVACGYPMIEPTRNEERAYFKATIPAVRAVREKSLQVAKHMCLSELFKAQRMP